MSLFSVDYFGVEGNLVYESEDTLNRGHASQVLKKGIGSLHSTLK